MKVLGIESSCDETGVALVDAAGEGVPQLLAQALHSQVDMHQAYGGVVPELASRDHIRRVLPLARQVLAEAGRSLQDIDLVAYTRGPGLAGALLVGAGVAVALAEALGRPTLGVHHLEGHLLSPFLSADPPQFPFVALLVSGGHTQLMRVDGRGALHVAGRDHRRCCRRGLRQERQAAGAGLPGRSGAVGAGKARARDAFALPRPLLHSAEPGLLLCRAEDRGGGAPRKLGAQPSDAQRADMAASVQAAIVDVLCAKSLRALQATGLSRLVVAGGVGANASLRQRLDEDCRRIGARVHYPEPALCTDNGAMIAWPRPCAGSAASAKATAQAPSTCVRAGTWRRSVDGDARRGRGAALGEGQRQHAVLQLGAGFGLVDIGRHAEAAREAGQRALAVDDAITFLLFFFLARLRLDADASAVDGDLHVFLGHAGQVQLDGVGTLGLRNVQRRAAQLVGLRGRGEEPVETVVEQAVEVARQIGRVATQGY
jgi:N6-L-threonylcarbamoyladenine synthase